MCDVSETCLIRSYANTAFTVHCSKVMLHSKHLTVHGYDYIDGWGNVVCNLLYEFKELKELRNMAKPKEKKREKE